MRLPRLSFRGDRQLDERSPISGHKVESANSHQRLDRLAYARARHEVPEEGFEILLVGGADGVEILGDQCGKAGYLRKFNSFADRVRCPAVKHVPESAFTFL